MRRAGRHALRLQVCPEVGGRAKSFARFHGTDFELYQGDMGMRPAAVRRKRLLDDVGLW